MQFPQQKIHAFLCTNCGGQNFFVESAGKIDKNLLADKKVHLKSVFE